MQIKILDTDCFYSIPLQQIRIDKFDISIDSQFCYCSLYNTSLNEDAEDPTYFIKIYDYTTLYSEENISLISKKPVLINELRFIPFVPMRGNMKWILLGILPNKRSLYSFLDYRISDLLTHNPPHLRKWRVLKNGDLDFENDRSFFEYDQVKHLDFGYEFGELTIKMRIYILIINKAINAINERLTFDEWKAVLFQILRLEESARKASDIDLRNDIVDYYSYDFLYGILDYNEIWG